MSSHWPTGDYCPECDTRMEVEAVGTLDKTITWQECDGCQLGWGPFTGYVDISAGGH